MIDNAVPGSGHEIAQALKREKNEFLRARLSECRAALTASAPAGNSKRALSSLQVSTMLLGKAVESHKELAEDPLSSEVEGRKKRKRRRDSDSEESGDEASHKLNRLDNRIARLAEESPGTLLATGLSSMEKFLLHKGFTKTPASAGSMPPRAVSYLVTVLQQSAELGVRSERELRTLATCLDLLCAGELPALGDTLMQRFKAIEMASSDSSWQVGRHLELIPPAQVSTTQRWERQQAASLELSEIKLRDRLTKAKGSGKGNH